MILDKKKKKESKNMLDCPFCKSDINECAFLNSENFLAIYNISPILPGHSLIIPKAHIESLLDLTEKELFEFVRLGQKVVKVLLKAFDTDSFNWTIQEKEPAGQTIQHLHMHIIPRKSHDLPEVGDWYPLLQKNKTAIIDSELRPKLNPEELKKIVEHIKGVITNLQS